MPRPVTLKARLVFPIAAPPIRGGCVTILGERIANVGPSPGDANAIDLGDVAVIPGLVNAHTHLEFSDLAAPLGAPGNALPDWIRQVMAYRNAPATAVEANVMRGLAECLRAGTTTVGDVATSDWRAAVGAHGCDMPAVVMFREAIAPSPQRVEAAVGAVESFLNAPGSPSLVAPAISPHAPYTVHPQLLERMIGLSQQHGVPLAMHLAESPEELQLLRDGTGPFQQLLADLNAWSDAPDARYTSILKYLEVLSRAPRSLVVHGNYLSEEEQAFIARRAATMCVVYCARTHAYFQHEAYPLAALLARGVRVALGTDGRGSNPDLDLWAELKFVRARHPQVAPETLLELATRNGAQALGFESSAGTLEPGKLANLAIVKLPGGAGDPHQRLLDDESRVVETVLRGRPLTAGSW